jgi:hypothetical protein
MAGMMGGANHLGVGDRPSESHHWVPGMGWVFMPTFEEGNEASVQGAARDNNDAFQYEVLENSVADAKASGVTSYGSAQGYSLPADVSAKIRARQASHDWYTGGMDHYSGPVEGDSWKAEAEGWLLDRNGRPTISPWINTFDHDAENTFNRMREANYNPFLGSEGRWVGDEQAGIGELNGYNEDSIAAWFKNAFAGDDMVKHRREALDTLNGWNTQVRNPNYQSNMDRSERWMDGKGHGINKGTKRMNKRYFDEMGLGEKFGLTYVDPRQEAYDQVTDAITGGPSGTGGSTGGSTGGTGGFMDAYNSSRPRPMNPPVPVVDVFPNGSMGGNHLDPFKEPQVKPGGFMESYLKKKAENKPSVMSLMTELKDA